MATKGSVFITGCSDGGIGSAFALNFVNRGFLVFATARDISHMSKLENLDNVTLLALDVLQPAQIEAAVAAVSKATGGTLDYLINNAGQTRFMPLLDENVEDAKKLFDTNLFGPLRLIQAFSELLIKAKGSICLISSVSGRINVPWQGIYAATKASLEVIGDNLRVELAPFDVKVMTVITGAVQSNAHAQYKNWPMPENSRYKAVEEQFTKRAAGDDGATRMDTHKYVEGVVNKLVAGKTTKLWHGEAAGIIKWAIGWWPTWLLDKAFSVGTGIDTMMKNKKYGTG